MLACAAAACPLAAPQVVQTCGNVPPISHAHFSIELPAVQSHDVTLPEAAGHMSGVAVDQLPDWLL
jgi:hypothetical protein